MDITRTQANIVTETFQHFLWKQNVNSISSDSKPEQNRNGKKAFCGIIQISIHSRLSIHSRPRFSNVDIYEYTYVLQEALKNSPLSAATSANLTVMYIWTSTGDAERGVLLNT